LFNQPASLQLLPAAPVPTKWPLAITGAHFFLDWMPCLSPNQWGKNKHWMSSYPESKLIPKERDATRLCWLSHASTGIQTTATSAGKNDVTITI